MPIKIFISYSHKDETLMEEFFEFIQPLIQSGKIHVWNDKAIGVGDIWDDEIIKSLEESDLALFLISPSFLASSYINKVEIAKAFEYREQNKLKIIPVMIRPCDLDSHIVPNSQYCLKNFQGLPTGMKPIIKWETHEDGWINVINGIKSLINK